MNLSASKKNLLKHKSIFSALTLAAAVVLIFWTVSNPAIVGVSASQRELPVYCVQREDKIVALSFDAAWGNEDTQTLIDILNHYNINTTFFVVGDWVDKYPNSIKQIYLAGHEIANHSNTHPHVNKLSYEENINEINLCSEKVKKITGNPTTLYRGPYGEYNNTVIEAANSVKHQTIQWNIDTLDYKGLTKEEMYSRIEKNLCPGSIVLMHSGAENTATALPYIIENIINQGYEIVTVSDIIYKDNFYIDIQGKQKLLD